ncbi:LysM peptidoglycan-binding domain-containing protein [Sphingomonas gilva]|uniref:LysM peptidoglycan-binding domain-containing protein n=1 Tax=Sphingomonas gilva TaxID=2305907 RepID=A0A396S0K0_9SPHN|nr:LysM peptidoglycan-binding domain-containing protein [Sphingomonas gilva]RHW16875.1 LysM peptidoglycan-binding domain-containing protein [Sphingomonas gilva]
MARLIREERASFLDHDGVAVTPAIDYAYDGLGNLTRTRQAGAGDAGGRVTRNLYDAGGRLEKAIDAAGGTFDYAYDAAGNQLARTWTRLASDGTARHEGLLSSYDRLGRLTAQATAGRTTPSAQWDKGVVQATRYNAYGEIAAQATHDAADAPAWQQQLHYDHAGRLIATNAGDGVWRYFLHDAAGRQTLTLTFQGVGASPLTLENYAATITAAGGTSAADAVTTVTVHDKRGQAIQTRAPDRELSATTSATLTTTRQYNAFGEVIWERDARANADDPDASDAWRRTEYAYNAMGRLTSITRPQVKVTAEDGLASDHRPVEQLRYDAAGRLVATIDANGNTTTRTLLAGTGHSPGSEALVTKEFHADGGVFQTLHDIHGDARILRNELHTGANAIESDELRQYDANGRLTQTTRRGGLLTEYYAYDILGQRTRHWNDFYNTNVLNPSVLDRTDYDREGRIISQITAAGSTDAITTLYSYEWQGGIATTGMGSFGGWVKETVNSSNKTATETTDLFGHVTARTDYGDHDYTYAYDAGGRMIAQETSAGADVAYGWYNSGQLAQVVTGTDNGYSGSTATASYEYDEGGNRTREKHAVTGHYYDYYNGTATSYTISHQDAEAEWDALGRMTSYADTGVSGSAPVTVAYEYDLVGNIRHVLADYRKIDYQGNVTSTVETQDYWYRYDAMNRVVTNMGELSGARGATGTVIQRGDKGEEITYDAAGRRKTVNKMTNSLLWQGWMGTPVYPNQGPMVYSDTPYVYSGYHWSQVERYYYGEKTDTYNYTIDGHISGTTTISQSAIVNPYMIYAGPMGSSWVSYSYSRDELGRVLSYVEYKPEGGVAYGTSSTYNKRDELATQTVSIIGEWSSQTSTTTYDYRAETSSGVYTGVYMGGVVTHSRTTNSVNGNAQPTSDTENVYQWWDGARLQQVVYDPNIAQSGANNTSSYYYDDAGHLASVYIQDGQPRTVSFVTNAEGLVLRRQERGQYSTPVDLHYYFDGVRIGDVGNDWGIRADFDQNADDPGGREHDAAPGRYTVQAGDTLASVAASLWGDANLWWRLAEANGLSGAETLAPGQSLTVPQGVTRTGNHASTFRPYDPGKAQGDLAPIKAKPQAAAGKDDGCGGIGAILLIAVAVAVTVWIAPQITPVLTKALGSATAGAIAGGAAAGAAGSIASQGLGLATGLQQGGFNWKGVALAAIGGAVGGGLQGVDAFGTASGLAKFGSDVVRGALGNAVSQGIAVATRLQSKFDFAAVAAAGIGAGVGGGVARGLGSEKGLLGIKASAGKFGNNAASTMADAITNAATRSLVEGTSFGDNVLAALPSAIGNTLGRTLGNAISDAFAGNSRTGKAAGANGESGFVNSRAIDAAAGRAFSQFDRGLYGDDLSLNLLGLDPYALQAIDNARINYFLEAAGGNVWEARNAIMGSYGPSYEDVTTSGASPATGTMTGTVENGEWVGRTERFSVSDGSRHWNEGMTSFGRFEKTGEGQVRWIEDVDTMARVNADLTKVDMFFGGIMAVGAAPFTAPLLAEGGIAAALGGLALAAHGNHILGASAPFTGATKLPLDYLAGDGASAVLDIAALGGNLAHGSIRGIQSWRAARASKASGLGDLTVAEVAIIQDVVNQAGRPLEIVGSAARGSRMIGSDIDYVVPPGSLKYYEGLENRLPGLDLNHGIIPGHGNPNLGPVIRFEPKGKL